MMARTTPDLSRAEWRAVAIALNDAERSPCAPARRSGRMSRFWTALTGNEPPRPLADPRLETLRGYVCAVRRRARRAEAYVPDLFALGFNRAQLDAIAILAA
jgi:hypothetical protein